jgi:hypothetical protein
MEPLKQEVVKSIEVERVDLVSRRSATRRRDDRELKGCISFDYALAETITGLTGCSCEIKDYDNADTVRRRWFALEEDGAGH